MTKYFSCLAVTVMVLISSLVCSAENPLHPVTLNYNDVFVSSFLTSNNIRIHNYEIHDLDYYDLQFTSRNTAFPLDGKYLSDKEGIIMNTYKGKDYYHPLAIAQMVLIFVNGFHVTGDKEYIARAEKHADKLISLSIQKGDAIFFPYPFDFALHGMEAEKLMSPWFSGIAQGEALSAFIRLYSVTRESKYLEQSKQIFNSLTRVKGVNDSWVVFIDEDRYLWIEEYPYKYPTRVLNGFISSILGLYEFYQVTHDERCLALMNAAITTVQHYIEDYRVEGGISYYDLHWKKQIASYHLLHIELIRTLYKITQDEKFKTMADYFYDDYYASDKIKNEINAGKPFTAILDKLDVDIGTISKGSTFKVQLKNGKFEATGIRKGETSPVTASYPQPLELNCRNCISIWDVWFQYDKNSNLRLDNKIVGRLVLNGK